MAEGKKKKRKKENLKAFRKQDNNTINEKISQSNTSSGNGEQTSVNRNTQPNFASKNIMDKPIPDMPAATAPKQLDLFGGKSCWIHLPA